MRELIKENVPNSEVILNCVPKMYADKDIYCQMVPNDDPDESCYAVVPRRGAFEISINGTVSDIQLHLFNISYYVASLL